LEGKEEPLYYNLKVGTKVGLRQIQMESCQPIKRLRDKKKKKKKKKPVSFDFPGTTVDKC